MNSESAIANARASQGIITANEYFVADYKRLSTFVSSVGKVCNEAESNDISRPVKLVVYLETLSTSTWDSIRKIFSS